MEQRSATWIRLRSDDGGADRFINLARAVQFNMRDAVGGTLLLDTGQTVELSAAECSAVFEVLSASGLLFEPS